MGHFPEKLELLTKATQGADIFERAWKMVQECGEEERHFNQLQSVYRGVASTWLLATLGAVGYLLFNKDMRLSDPHFNPYLVAAVICLLGAIGISLIWILDLMVYHRLLVAVFEEGRKLEQRFDWLPKLRTAMFEIGRTNADHRDPIRRMLAYYYVGTAGVPLVCSPIFFSLYLRDSGVTWYRYLFLLLILAAAILFRSFKWTTSAAG